MNFGSCNVSEWQDCRPLSKLKKELTAEKLAGIVTITSVDQDEHLILVDVNGSWGPLTQRIQYYCMLQCNSRILAEGGSGGKYHANSPKPCPDHLIHIHAHILDTVLDTLLYCSSRSRHLLGSSLFSEQSKARVEYEIKYRFVALVMRRAVRVESFDIKAYKDSVTHKT